MGGALRLWERLRLGTSFPLVHLAREVGEVDVLAGIVGGPTCAACCWAPRQSGSVQRRRGAG